MAIYICKRCQKTYSYCRACLLSPISYKANGYCSKECSDVALNKKEVIPAEDVEVVITDRDISTSE